MSGDDFYKAEKEKLLKAFRETMARQFASHVKTFGGLSPVDLRNVARTFAIAWCEALHSQGLTMAVYAWAKNFGGMTLEDWWPGDEWKWW